MEPPILPMSSNFVAEHDSALLENGASPSPFSAAEDSARSGVHVASSEEPPTIGSLVGDVKFPDRPVDLIFYNEDVTQEIERK